MENKPENSNKSIGETKVKIEERNDIESNTDSPEVATKKNSHSSMV